MGFEKKLSYKEKKEQFHGNAEYRRKVFERFLQHLEDGYSGDCFGEMDEQSLVEACKKYPEECCEGEIVDAKRRGKGNWERLGKAQADGSCMGNSRTWFYNMAQRYKWSDRQQIDANVNGNISVNVVNFARSKLSHDSDGADDT